MKFLCLFLVLILVVICPSTLYGQEKPKVEVSFNIKEENYRDNFGTEITYIEEEGKKKLIKLLNEYFGFVTFVEHSSSKKLCISLEDKEPHSLISSQLREVGFRLSLEEQNIATASEIIYWGFRPIEKYDLPLGTKDALIKEVSASFEKHLNERRDEVVAKLMKKLPIADQAFLYYYDNKPYWLIPVEIEKSRLDLNSEFVIATIIEIPVGNENKEYKTRMIGSTKEKMPEVPQLYWNGKVLSIGFAPENELAKMKCGNEIMVAVIKYVPAPKKIIEKTPPNKLDTEKKEIEE